jgi:hypothetical protein
VTVAVLLKPETASAGEILVDRVAFAHEQRERHRDNDENEGDFPGHTRAHRR